MVMTADGEVALGHYVRGAISVFCNGQIFRVAIYMNYELQECACSSPTDS